MEVQVTGQVKFVHTFMQKKKKKKEAQRIEERIIPGIDELADEALIDGHCSIVRRCRETVSSGVSCFRFVYETE